MKYQGYLSPWWYDIVGMKKAGWTVYRIQQRLCRVIVQRTGRYPSHAMIRHLLRTEGLPVTGRQRVEG